jgi:hypothetical protein
MSTSGSRSNITLSNEPTTISSIDPDIAALHDCPQVIAWTNRTTEPSDSRSTDVSNNGTRGSTGMVVAFKGANVASTLAFTDRPSLQAQAASNRHAVASSNVLTAPHTALPIVTSVNGSNVLASHRAKSGNSPNTLTPQQLATYAQALNQNQLVTLSHNAAWSGSNSSSSTPSWTPNQVQFKSVPKTRKRCSQIQTPSSLGFYSPRSKSILKDAKMKYRIYIATQVAFPTTVQALENAVIKYNMSGDEYATDTDSERDQIPLVDAGRLQVVSL